MVSQAKQRSLCWLSRPLAWRARCDAGQESVLARQSSELLGKRSCLPAHACGGEEAAAGAGSARMS